MAEKPKCGCRLSRRRFVQLSAVGVATTGGIADGLAPHDRLWRVAEGFKGTKEQAGYIQKTEPSPQDCSTCHSFLDPDDCILVEGPVSPLGWCNWYSD